MAKTLFTFVICLLAALPAAAGVVFEIQTIDQYQGRQRSGTTQVRIEGQFLSIDIPPDSPGERGSQLIFRGDRREMLIVDHDSKSFMIMDQQSMKNMLGQLNQVMAQTTGQLEGVLGNVPEAQRAMIEEMMRKKSPAQQTQQQSRSVVRRLNDRATVYGYPCVLYEVVRDGRRIRNLWVTDWQNIEGGSRQLAPVFDNLGSFFQELLSTIPQMGQSDDISNNVFAQIKELGGFPVATREYTEDGNLESESALRTAKRQQFNSATFKPPTGYQPQQLFGGGQPAQYRR